MTQIDIVLMHVDGSVPGFADRCREYTGDYVPCQYRDLGELRFVLRSISENAPWAKVVLAVQDDRHVPEWVDPNALRIVKHEEFIPSQHLPTFHWATVFAHLDRIPGLSERYVAWSNDMLVASPLSVGDFFDDDGIPRTGFGIFPVVPFQLSRNDLYQAILIDSLKLLRRQTGRRRVCILYPHMPVPISRGLWQEQFRLFAADPAYARTVTMRSRGNEREIRKIAPITLFANWVDICKRERSTAARLSAMAREALLQFMWKIPLAGPQTPPRFGKYAIVNNADRMRKNMARMLRERATFINVNDDAYDGWGWPGSEREVNPQSLSLLHETLTTLFPAPGRFERT